MPEAPRNSRRIASALRREVNAFDAAHPELRTEMEALRLASVAAIQRLNAIYRIIELEKDWSDAD